MAFDLDSDQKNQPVITEKDVFEYRERSIKLELFGIFSLSGP